MQEADGFFKEMGSNFACLVGAFWAACLWNAMGLAEPGLAHAQQAVLQVLSQQAQQGPPLRPRRGGPVREHLLPGGAGQGAGALREGRAALGSLHRHRPDSCPQAVAGRRHHLHRVRVTSHTWLRALAGMAACSREAEPTWAALYSSVWKAVLGQDPIPGNLHGRQINAKTVV